jgi:FkbM family methyltransferase
MLIEFDQIIRKYGKPKGIIHIGAHMVEERQSYIKYGLGNTIWIEANPLIFSKICGLGGNTNELFFNYAISDVDNKICTLNVTNNGQSSSILELELHKLHHPHIFVQDTVQVNSKRMDTLIDENKIDISNYNFINLDIQGLELLALKGFGGYLNEVDYIYTEINTNYLYKECALVGEIDSYLSLFGFVRVETSITPFEWGDALYIRNDTI